ncbi:MAG: hypothetical protein KAT34_20930 [Candidatus Aminicenantes bacterium]|nr:hypothetical protein [Candidatus Aminicenantes bacterium]
MIRSANSKNLGYTKEADLENWPAAIRTLKEKYGEAKIVIPGHGKPGSLNLLGHTLKLLEENKR